MSALLCKFMTCSGSDHVFCKSLLRKKIDFMNNVHKSAIELSVFFFSPQECLLSIGGRKKKKKAPTLIITENCFIYFFLLFFFCGWKGELIHMFVWFFFFSLPDFNFRAKRFFSSSSSRNIFKDLKIYFLLLGNIPQWGMSNFLNHHCHLLTKAAPDHTR